MIKRKRRARLGVLLIVYTLVSLAAAAGVFFAARALGGYMIDRRVYTKERILSREKEYFNEFYSYLTENALSLTDRGQIEPWFEGRSDLIICAYNGGMPFAKDDNGVIIYSSVSDAGSVYELLQQEYEGYWYTRPITVKGDYMRSKTVRVMYFPMYSAHRALMYASVLLAFAVFALCLMLLVRRKTRYMSELSAQLAVMESGDLSVPMRIRGNDEITTLAENTEQMRLSFIERLRHEEEMTRSSQQLLTDMSHDLRTPLTALIGYLDLIDGGKCESEAQKAKYISSAKKRAYQIKDMTDELFEYFLVYSEQDETLETEQTDAVTLYMQLWEESAFTLESEGFKTELAPAEESACLNVNVKLLRRVFDNVASNVRKYADKNFPVRAKMYAEGGYFVFEAENRILEGNSRAESSGVGLAFCKRCAERHGGAFESGAENGSFICKLKLPTADRSK
ncbi:MAG: HAMP domain-containing histidine kinase [Clostridia bacterium]|nr:HAMP domain-containing histidine kinase [Clostridia bacterium]